MAEPRIAVWHPDFIDDPEFSEVRSPKSTAHYLSLLGPFLETYKQLTVEDYWGLTVSEHQALRQWLVASGVVKEPDGE